METFTKDLPGSIAKSEANACAGLAPPKPIADGLGFNDLICGCVGLYPGITFKTVVDVLDSSSDKKGLWLKTQAVLPVLPNINWTISNESYMLTCGINNSLSLPIIDGSITVDFLNETFAMTTTGPISSSWRLMVCGKEIFDIPGGFCALIGDALVDAIVDLIS